MKPSRPRPLAWLTLTVTLVSTLVLVPGSTEAEQDTAGPLPRVEALTHKNYTDAIAGTEVKFDMVAVPGGTFLMGSPASEKGRNADEGPQHPVTVRPFWIGKCEVTWDEYDPYAKANPGNKQEQLDAEKKKIPQKEMDALSRPTPPYADETFGYGREGFPALSMTHHAAMEYCRWLSEKTGKTYRLPTEAEWEWACRAGSKGAYGFGDDDAKLADHAWFAGNSEDSPHKVATRKANAWGVHDLHGNVAEWCLDLYRKDAYAARPLDKAALMPAHLPTDARYSHTVRGGSWADKAPGVRCAARRGSDKEWNKQDPQIPKSLWWFTDADFVGFRVVRAAADEPPLKDFRSKIKWESK